MSCSLLSKVLLKEQFISEQYFCTSILGTQTYSPCFFLKKKKGILLSKRKHTVLVGNELSGSGVGARVDADQYAQDVLALKQIIDNSYQGHASKPLVIAPGGFFDAAWFTELISRTKPNQMDVMTHHIYNLGPGMIPVTDREFST